MTVLFGEHLAYLAAREIFLGTGDTEVNTGTLALYAALSTSLIASSDLNKAHLDLVTSFVEYDGAGYSRQALGSIVIAEGAASHLWSLKCADLDFGVMDAASGGSAKALVIYLGLSDLPGDDGDAYLAGFIQGTDAGVLGLPFFGDGVTALVLPVSTFNLFQGPNAST